MSEDKGITKENTYITILVLYYIFIKKSSKVEKICY